MAASPQSTDLTSTEIVRLYAAGRRDFAGLEFTCYLDFEGLDLMGIRFRDCWLDGHFIDCCLVDADFDGASIKTVDFVRCDLRGASFRRALIDATEFRGCSMANADFAGATAMGKRLPGGNYRRSARNDATRLPRTGSSSRPRPSGSGPGPATRLTSVRSTPASPR